MRGWGGLAKGEARSMQVGLGLVSESGEEMGSVGRAACQGKRWGDCASGVSVLVIRPVGRC